MGQLEGKVAIVTGASRGIGKAIAIGLAKQGANLVLVARDKNRLDEAKAEVVKLGVKAEAIPTDISIEEQVENLFQKTMKFFGKLDLLVNNAAMPGRGAIDKLTAEYWDKVINTNLRGPFLCTRAALRIMKKQKGGRIINIGSISAKRVRPESAPYSCAKFGLIGLSETTALEGRPFNISCSILHPGNTLTEIHSSNNLPEPDEPQQPADIMAGAAVYIACLPPDVTVLEMVQLPTQQKFLGRG
jgi:NAD(P)-dependent dehydrogenase (short-subunit alcohol dehydrogenase family)